MVPLGPNMSSGHHSSGDTYCPSGNLVTKPPWLAYRSGRENPRNGGAVQSDVGEGHWGQLVSDSDLKRFEEYSRFAAALIEEASKDELARCARALALGLARYRATYGDLSTVDSAALLEPEPIVPATAKDFADGMQNLVRTLASITQSRENPVSQ